VNTSSSLSDAALRGIFKGLGLQPTDLPLPTSAENPSDDEEKRLAEYLRARAKPILDRMPDDTEDHKTKKKRAEAAIRYCSVLPVTGTQFMVTREIEGSLTFRLINDKIEFLQEGCEELIQRLGIPKSWWGKKTHHPVTLAGRIEIYEHGLEASTIRGTLVTKKILYALKKSSKDMLLAAGALILFVIAVAVSVSGTITPESKLGGHLDRFATAMATTVIVSGYSIVHIILTATPPVAWTAYYEKEE